MRDLTYGTYLILAVAVTSRWTTCHLVECVKILALLANDFCMKKGGYNERKRVFFLESSLLFLRLISKHRICH